MCMHTHSYSHRASSQSWAGGGRSPGARPGSFFLFFCEQRTQRSVAVSRPNSPLLAHRPSAQWLLYVTLYSARPGSYSR